MVFPDQLFSTSVIWMIPPAADRNRSSVERSTMRLVSSTLFLFGMMIRMHHSYCRGALSRHPLRLHFLRRDNIDHLLGNHRHWCTLLPAGPAKVIVGILLRPAVVHLQKPFGA